MNVEQMIKKRYVVIVFMMMLSVGVWSIIWQGVAAQTIVINFPNPVVVPVTNTVVITVPVHVPHDVIQTVYLSGTVYIKESIVREVTNTVPITVSVPFTVPVYTFIEGQTVTNTVVMTVPVPTVITVPTYIGGSTVTDTVVVTVPIPTVITVPETTVITVPQNTVITMPLTTVYSNTETISESTTSIVQVPFTITEPLIVTVTETLVITVPHTTTDVITIPVYIPGPGITNTVIVTVPVPYPIPDPQSASFNPVSATSNSESNATIGDVTATVGDTSSSATGGTGTAEGGSAEGGTAEGGTAEGGTAEGGTAEGGTAEGGTSSADSSSNSVISETHDTDDTTPPGGTVSDDIPPTPPTPTITPTQSYDYSDAPSPFNQALHNITSSADTLFMGAGVDADYYAQAQSGDINRDNDDGIELSSIIQTNALTIPVDVTNLTGDLAYLYGYADLNGDGKFGEGEFSMITIEDGLDAENVELTFGRVLAEVGEHVVVRLRLTTDTNLSAIGDASDGEVEDYAIAVERPLELMVLNSIGSLDTSLTYTVEAYNHTESDTLVYGFIDCNGDEIANGDEYRTVADTIGSSTYTTTEVVFTSLDEDVDYSECTPMVSVDLNPAIVTDAGEVIPISIVESWARPTQIALLEFAMPIHQTLIAMVVITAALTLITPIITVRRRRN